MSFVPQVSCTWSQWLRWWWWLWWLRWWRWRWWRWWWWRWRWWRWWWWSWIVCCEIENAAPIWCVLLCFRFDEQLRCAEISRHLLWRWPACRHAGIWCGVSVCFCGLAGRLNRPEVFLQQHHEWRWMEPLNPLKKRTVKTSQQIVITPWMHARETCETLNLDSIMLTCVSLILCCSL